MNKIELVKEYLNKENIDAWIIIDYEMKNPVVRSLLGNKMLTRKLFMVIPKEGKPYLITHSIDTVFLHDSKDSFDLKIYHSWKEMLDLEKTNFSSYKKVLMDVSSYGLMDADAVLTAVESRSSSPVRIDREDFQAVGIRGLYPCGEGAGYAGGITSAAVDGIRCAEAVYANL